MKELLAILFFLIFPICGIQAISEGEIGMGIVFLAPLTVLLCVLAYQRFYLKPEEERQKALHKMYKLPRYVQNEYGEKWNREFQKVITKAIDSSKDPEKRSELQRCQSVAKEMIKDSGVCRLDRPFYQINNAFRLTGCHFTITDSKGNVITQIV